MAEVLREPATPETVHDPVEAERELARKNMLWGWALLGVFLLLFGGTVGVAFIYLWLD